MVGKPQTLLRGTWGRSAVEGQESVLLANKIYDTVIIGSGPAGYTAALYAARANLDTLVFQGFESGGQLMLTSDVENYPGYKDGVAGPDMMDDLEAQAARFGAEMRLDNVERVDFSGRPFRLWAEGEEEPVLARSVIIATGAKAKWLGLEGEQRLMGRGVSGCATCDGFFFREKRVAVVGGGDTAMEEEILGETSVEGVRIKNAKTGEEQTLAVDGFFAAIGHAPSTGIFEGLLEMDESGYILQLEHTMTSVPGVFAAGDVSDKRYRQAVTAAGDGCRAAIDAERWLEDQGEAEHAEDPGVWTAEKEMQEDPSQPVS